MSTQKSRKDFVSHSVLNDRYPHGRVEKITENGVWLEGQGKWFHFNMLKIRAMDLPKVGAYVVLTEDENHRITHIATQHEQQRPSDADIALIGSTMEATQQPNTAAEQPNTATEHVIPIVSMEDYRVRADALALAVQLLNLEAHYGIDRDDIYRVAQEVIRWIQKRGEE